MVLDVDTKQRRLSLGLKASYFDTAGDTEERQAQVGVPSSHCWSGTIRSHAAKVF